MKNLLKSLLTLTLVATTAISASAAKKEKSEKQIVKCEYSAEIDCQTCANKVMNTLPFQKGIKDVEVNLPAKKITVEYDASKSSNEAIIAQLSKLDIKASVCNDKKKEGETKSCHSACCAK